MATPDKAFINNLHDTLFNQYSVLDVVATYIAHKEDAQSMFCDHSIDIMDIRLEPNLDCVVVHYTLVSDGRVRYRTTYPMQWEVFLELTKDPVKQGHNPWTLQDYGHDCRPFRGSVKRSGPPVRVVTPDEAYRILREQAAAFNDEDTESK